MIMNKLLRRFLCVLFCTAVISPIVIADPNNIFIDLSGLNGADFQLEVALYDNSGVIGDSWVLLDDVFFGWMGEGFESGTPGMFDTSLNPGSVNAVEGNLNGAGNYVLRIDEDPLVTPTFTFADFEGSENGMLSFVYDIVASVTSGPFGLDQLVFSILDSDTLEPLVAGLIATFGDVLSHDSTGMDAQAKHSLLIGSTLWGSVVTPGEGKYEYIQYDSAAYSTVPITAKAEDYSRQYGWTDNIIFYEWIGTAVDAGKVANPLAETTTVLVDSDYTLIAKFVRTPKIKTVSIYDLDPPRVLFRGFIENDGGIACQTRFKYWKEGAGEECTPWVDSLRTSWSFSELMENLEPGADYHVIPQAQNPAGIGSGEEIIFTNATLPQLIISSTLCGSVIVPGEGIHGCVYQATVPVEAEPMDGNSLFLGWTGTAVDAGYVADSNALATTVYVDSTLTLCANFVSALDPIYVNAPDPNDPDANVPVPNGSEERPWQSIQDAIDVALDDVTIIVGAGLYEESVNFGYKQLQIQGQWLVDSNYMGLPTITPVGQVPAITINRGQDANSVLSGLSLSGSVGLGLLCDDASPTISHCLVSGNLGGGVMLNNSLADIINCTIANNGFDPNTGGLISWDSIPSLVNCVLWNNVPDTVYIESGEAGLFNYCLVEGGIEGDQIINVDPLFALEGIWDTNDTVEIVDDIWLPGDYHPQSEAGRYDPNEMVWVLDAVTSPLIDMADPNSDDFLETEPSGDRCNLGVFGGTVQASRSLSP